MENREYIKTGSQVYWRTLFIIFLGSMAAFGAEYCVQPIIPVIASSFGLNAVQGSLAVSLGLVGMSAAMLLIAGLAPRFDRKLATSVGLIGAAILTIMIGFSGSFEAILGMRLIQGLLLAAFPSLIIAYINEEFEPFNVGTVIGIYISGTTVGGLFGRLVVSAITDFVSWRMGLIVIGILYLAVGIAFFMLLPKPKYQRQRQSGGLQLIKTFHTALANKNSAIGHLPTRFYPAPDPPGSSPCSPAPRAQGAPFRSPLLSPPAPWWRPRSSPTAAWPRPPGAGPAAGW